jgi:hypothetical protein
MAFLRTRRALPLDRTELNEHGLKLDNSEGFADE